MIPVFSYRSVYYNRYETSRAENCVLEVKGLPLDRQDHAQVQVAASLREF